MRRWRAHRVGFHYLRPLLGVVGWWLFGPLPRLGYPRALLNAAGITVLLLGVGWLFLLGDRRLGDRARPRPVDDVPSPG